MAELYINENINDYYKKPPCETDIFFYRISDFDESAIEFVTKFNELSKSGGTNIKQRIPNPTDTNVEYYNNIIGAEFKLNQVFFIKNLQIWLPNLKLDHSKNIALEMFKVMYDMRSAGKTDGMIRSVYIKYMCWLYYNFNSAVTFATQKGKSYVIFQGDPVFHEIQILSILSKIGCDVLLIHTSEEKYKSFDPLNEKSVPYKPSGQVITVDIEKVLQQNSVVKETKKSNVAVPPAVFNIVTNNKPNEDPLRAILNPHELRGDDKETIYNEYYKIEGVDDLVYYKSQIHTFMETIRLSNSKLLTIEKGLLPPQPNELVEIKVVNTTNSLELLKSVVTNIEYPENNMIEKSLKREFIQVFSKDLDDIKHNILKNQMLTVVSWINKYKNHLFKGYKRGKPPVMIILNGASNGAQKKFIEIMAAQPIDILLYCPDLNKEEVSDDSRLKVVKYPGSMNMEVLPSNESNVVLSTVSYSASQDIDKLLYNEGMMFKDYQCKSAITAVLQTTYDEIKILWNEPAQIRPNFETIGDKITLPTICAKINGTIFDSDYTYWKEVQQYITQNTYLVKQLNFVNKLEAKEALIAATEFYKNGKLLKDKIKQHKSYGYGHLRDDIQNHILDKLEMLINARTIKGTLEFGVEYTIIGIVLSLDKKIAQLLQSYDFNKEIPKLIIIDTNDTNSTLEDAITVAFLSLAGFDVVIFSPTGYQKLEKHYNTYVFQQYNMGDLKYELKVPDLKYIDTNKNQFNIFRRSK